VPGLVGASQELFLDGDRAHTDLSMEPVAEEPTIEKVAQLEAEQPSPPKRSRRKQAAWHIMGGPGMTRWPPCCHLRRQQGGGRRQEHAGSGGEPGDRSQLYGPRRTEGSGLRRTIVTHILLGEKRPIDKVGCDNQINSVFHSGTHSPTADDTMLPSSLKNPIPVTS